MNRALDYFRDPGTQALLQVARLDKPVGTLLLLWPTLSALWIASDGWPGWHLFLVFVLGTFLTRSAGCVVNDISDRSFDGHVKRTENRPLATGALTVKAAVIWMGVLLTGALLLVLTTNLPTIILAGISALIAGLYPLMKRITHLPQVVLGVAFSFGIPMAFTAALGEVTPAAGLLFCANLVWVIAYDTEYAMVDRDDDLKIGIKSTAILFGELDRLIIGILQAMLLILLWQLGKQLDYSHLYTAFLIAISALCIQQQWLIRHRHRDLCFSAFKNNQFLGLLLFSAIFIEVSVLS
jgi:4-hydroxybenzoate polyprenyltransferase